MRLSCSAKPEPLHRIPGRPVPRNLLSGRVHVEFVKDPTPDLDLRMLDYRLRLRRRDRTTPITQHVLALRDIPIPERYDDPTQAG